MIDTQAIRNKVLDLAIHGKLTEQLPEDGTAEELYHIIQAEKRAATRKKKTIEATSCNSVDVPSNWYICSFDSINFYTSITINPSKTKTTNYELYSVPYYALKKPEIIKGENIGSAKHLLQENDVLVCKINPHINRVWLVTQQTNHMLIGSSEWIPFRNNRIDAHYLCYYFQSPFFRRYMQSNLSGVGGSLTRAKPEFVKRYPVLLPPIAEQHRIVESIEKVFTYLDTIDTLQAKYADNLTILKSKLIDAAIQGKMTEHLPGDGTAEELYQMIRTKKQALINEGKIKKEKPLPDIIENEVPFEIPANWKWIRVGEVGSWSAGATPSRRKERYYHNGTIPWLKTGELNDGYIRGSEEYITEDALRECSVRINPVGSVLIAMYGATIGKTGILEIEATTNQACCACIPIEIDNKYLSYFLISNKNRFLDASHGGAQPNISKEIIVKSLFPLPPLAEQIRIVELIDSLIKTIEGQKKNN